jgi:hypothetical protein
MLEAPPLVSSVGSMAPVAYHFSAAVCAAWFETIETKWNAD